MRGKGKMFDVIILLLITVVLGSFGQVSMKKGLMSLGGIKLTEILSRKLFDVVFQKYVLIGIILYSFSTLLWFVILSRAELSFVYPLIALGYVLTALLARLIFNELITPVRWFGILLILGGAALIMAKF